jgi:hypothetical protein
MNPLDCCYRSYGVHSQRRFRRTRQGVNAIHVADWHVERDWTGIEFIPLVNNTGRTTTSNIHSCRNESAPRGTC